MENFNEFVGIPFRWGGRTIEHGLDCWGLCRLVLGRLGLEHLPDWEYPPNDYRRIAYLALLETMNGDWRELTMDYPKLGDVVMLGSPRVLHHVGLVAPEGGVLHTAPQVGSLVQSWPMLRICGYRRFSIYRHKSYG